MPIFQCLDGTLCWLFGLVGATILHILQINCPILHLSLMCLKKRCMEQCIPCPLQDFAKQWYGDLAYKAICDMHSGRDIRDGMLFLMPISYSRQANGLGLIILRLLYMYNVTRLQHRIFWMLSHTSSWGSKPTFTYQLPPRFDYLWLSWGPCCIHQYQTNKNGKRVGFEKYVTFIQHECPITKKQNDHKGTQQVNVWGTESAGLGGSLKSGRGTTGVKMHYHKYRYFQNLNKDQHNKLKEW